jgi:hypothetical protein
LPGDDAAPGAARAETRSLRRAAGDGSLNVTTDGTATCSTTRRQRHEGSADDLRTSAPC